MREPMMNPNTMDEESIFKVACKITEPEARESYLLQICGDNQPLLERVSRLLKEYDQQPSFLENFFSNEVDTAAFTALPNQTGSMIGPYKLLEPIGEGGMGTVYMAEQTEPVRRRVAIKLIKPGMDSKQVIARFDAERQALAMMDHPNIAKVFDAGTTESGRPYFVMELVKGLPVTEFCDQQKLSTDDRLKLFRQICQAVQHAHQKGIIHRDLKPNNILIAMYDDQPVPKVIDFGVAKAISEPLSESTFFTRFGEVVGTLAYMSPEQAQFNQLDIDTRSDIYSLGSILYELLVGEPPFDKQRLKSQAFDETLRMIREEEPTKPSTKIDSAEHRAKYANSRNTTSEKLASLVSGELDWIVMKALEKDRSRRYETANEFASDIVRYLRYEPVSAGPPSAAYRFRKFARRNKIALLTSAAVAVVLILGIFGTTWQMFRAIDAEEIANNETLRATDALLEKATALEAADKALEKQEALATFIFKGVIDAAKPNESGKPDTTVRNALKLVDASLHESLPDDPAQVAWLQLHLGKYFNAIGEYELAIRNLEEAMSSQHVSGDIDFLIKVRGNLASSYRSTGEHAKAVTLARQNLEASSEMHGESHSSTVKALNLLGVCLKNAGDLEEAKEVLLRTVELSKQPGLEITNAYTMNNLAGVFFALGDYDEAKVRFEQTIKRYREVFDSDRLARELTIPITSLGLIDRQFGDFESARSKHEEALSMLTGAFGENHPRVITATNSLAFTNMKTGNMPEAARLFTIVERSHQIRFGEDSLVTAKVRNILGWVQAELGNEVEALKMLRSAIEISTRVGGSSNGIRLSASNTLGQFYKKRNEWDAALDCFENVIQARTDIRKKHPNDIINVRTIGGTYCNLGNIYAKRKQYETSIEKFTTALTILEELASSDQSQNTKKFMSFAYRGRARSTRLLGHFQQSIDDYQRAIDVATSDSWAAIFEIQIYKARAQLGDYESIVERVRAITKEFPDGGVLHYEAAQLLAIVSGVARQDSKNIETERPTLVDPFIDEAIRYLVHAKEVGAFKKYKQSFPVDDLITDPDFLAIRNHEKFKEFVSSFDSAKDESNGATQEETDK